MARIDIAEDIQRWADEAREGFSALSEPVLRLGVTGLSGAGKTVFITSLVANLLDRGRMLGLTAEAEGRILAAALRPRPDRETPRFDYESHLGALLSPEPHWPESTRRISTLRLSFRLRPSGLAARLRGPRALHLDITDYPGEWLLDLPLMSRSYADWSARALAEAETPARAPHAEAWLRLAHQSADAPFSEETARRLADRFAAYLAACRRAGLSGLAPGRFLMPGDLEGSPALAFAPLPPGPRTGLRAEMEKRYETYKRAVVKPFFRDHFAKLDRQIVLVDLLSALASGPPAVDDLREALARILEAFRPGERSWLAPLLGRRIDRILFAATKADHLHHTQHPRLSAVLQALLREAESRAAFRGARTAVLSVAALRATTEQEVMRDARPLPCVRGRRADTGVPAAFHPGDLPESPAAWLEAARSGAGAWPDGDIRALRFAPPRLTLRPGEGPPHIRLDRAADFLLGDRLR
ncbi:MAG: YcjX family protein [Pseudomonadota bacterium]